MGDSVFRKIKIESNKKLTGDKLGDKLCLHREGCEGRIY